MIPRRPGLACSLIGAWYGLFAVASAGHAQPPAAKAVDHRWDSIRHIFGQDGETEGRYFRINLPRTDLSVRIGNDTLESGFELTSYVGFMPAGARNVVAMGELVLRAEEVEEALTGLRRGGVRVTAVHNHLIGEVPRIVYVHVMALGAPEAVATKLRAVFAKTATPLTPEKPKAATTDWRVIDAVLGPHAEAEATVAEYVFPRNERLRVHQLPVESTGLLETASEVVFQQLGNGRVACGGELFVLPSEVDPVVRALDEHGLHVSAVHNHMVDETPTMNWIHWYATGDGAMLARGVAAALARMNGAQKSRAEH